MSQQSVEQYLNEMSGQQVEHFWMDSIKTHCYVIFSSVMASEKARNSIHGIVWPFGEKGRKPLSAGYIPVEKCSEWEKQEQDDLSIRWEVLYEKENQEVECILRRITDISALGIKVISKIPQKEDFKDINHTYIDSNEQAMPLLRPDDIFRKTVTKPALFYLETRKY